MKGQFVATAAMDTATLLANAGPWTTENSAGDVYRKATRLTSARPHRIATSAQKERRVVMELTTSLDQKDAQHTLLPRRRVAADIDGGNPAG